MITWFRLLMCTLVLCISNLCSADEKTITSASCEAIEFFDIPVGDFTWPMTMPETEMRITQGYNTSYADGYCNADDGTQPSSSSPSCVGKKIHYGHDGIDIHEKDAWEGKNQIFATQNAIVVASHKTGTSVGWGESMFLGVRANEYSEQIMTLHYHHMYQSGTGSDYTTSRLFNACELVVRGETIGMEGRSGTGAVHLHYTVRRWNSFKELKDALKNNGKNLYTSGYAYGDTNKLQSLLHPLKMLHDQYGDFEPDQSDQVPEPWAQPYALNMRHKGIEFGLYDGQFGRIKHVKRREAARWIKIATDRESVTPGVSTFPDDVPLTDVDSPYIEALTKYPQTVPVINPQGTCENGAKKFCPDADLKRAEVLKMIVLAFYDKQFLKMYENDIWRNSYVAAMSLLTTYQDVDPLSWYAPYVYFGTSIGLVSDQQLFRPADPVTRSEMAKWVMIGYTLTHDMGENPCNTVSCSAGQYCDQQTLDCSNMVECVPVETLTCDVGGGYIDPCIDDPTCAGPCTPGFTMVGTCPNLQTKNRYSKCQMDGTWGPWTSCDPIQPQPACNTGEVQNQDCGTNGTQTRSCDQNGQWTSWSTCQELPQQPTCVCSSGPCCDGCNFYSSSTSCDLWYTYQCAGSNPGDNAQKAMVKQYCPGNSESCTGAVTQFGWQTQEDCSTSQVCTLSQGVATCMGACQDTYTENNNSSCSDNPQGIGTPTLCLEVKKVSGTDFQYRVCKQGSTFSNNFSYKLKDANNNVNFSTFNGSSGTTCTPWKSMNVGYISGYGSINGAGMYAEVISPQGCSQSGCSYHTGSITISKICQ